MANRFLSNITINDSYTLPSADGSQGQVITTDGSGNLSFSTISVNTADSNFIYYNVKNSSGSTINKGTAVMATGTDGNSGHILIEPMVADGTVEAKYFMGVLESTLGNGEIGRVIHFGELDQFNTSTFTNGDVLWCDPATPGGFTATEPLGPNLKLAAAIVINSATNGKIKVRVQGNAGLHELHDVKLVSEVNGDLLQWNSTASVWENKTLASIADSRYVNVSGDTMTNNLNFDTTEKGVTWTMNTDGASIKFYNTGDADTDSRLEFQTTDNNNEYFRWTHRNTSETYELMRLTGNGTGGNLLVSGNITAISFIGSLTGNADTASTLETARNIAVDGAVTGNADFDGSGDITITTTVNHNHDDRYYTETESDNRFVNVDGDTMTGSLTLSGNGSDMLFLDVASTSNTTDQNAIRYLTNGSLKAQVGVPIDNNRILADTNADDFVIKSWGDIRFGGGTIGTTTVLIDSETGDIGTVGDINADGDLSIDGTITGSTARFTATSGHAFGDIIGTSRVVSFMNSALSDGTPMYLTIGVAETTNNQGEISFYYNSAGSAANELRLGLYGDPDMVTINGNGHLTVTSGNFAVESGVIKMGATTVIDASENAYFATTKSSYFFSTLNTTVSGAASKDWVYLGSGARAAGVIVNDVSGARYSIQAGSYDLKFAKHISSSDTWSNVMAFESLGVDTNADVRIYNDLTIDGSLFVNGTIDLSDANLDIGSADIIFDINATDTGARGLVWNFDADGNGTASNIGYIRAGGTTIGEKMQFNMNAEGTNTGADKIYQWFNGGEEVLSISANGNILFDGDATVTNQARGIKWTAYDKEGVTDYSDTAHIIHTTASGGLAGSVLEIRAYNDAQDGVNFVTNNNDSVRINGNIILNGGNYTNVLDPRYVNVSGDTMTGDLNLTDSDVLFTDGYGIARSSSYFYLPYTTTVGDYIVGTHAESAANYTIVCDFDGTGTSEFFQVKAGGGTPNILKLLSKTTSAGVDNNSLLLNGNVIVNAGNYAQTTDLRYYDRTTSDNRFFPFTGGTITGDTIFNDVAVFNGQVNYNSEDRSSYWSYDNKVAAVFKPAADDGAVAILFPSIGNSVSDFGYIAFDEDYGEAGVTAGENSVLLIGCENDGLNSSDHVRVKGRLVVEANMSSSDPTVAFDVKDGNNTDYLFRVNRSGSVLAGSTLTVADRLTVDDAIRLTSNPSITGDTSGVYFWNQAGVGATIASNAFEVRTNGNTTAFSIDNGLNATFADDLTVGSYLYVGGSTGISSAGWIHLHRYSSNLNVAVGNNGTNVNLYVPNGDVSIGIATPSVRLHVVDNTEEVVRIQSGTTGAIHFFEGSTRRGILGYSNGTSIGLAADAGDMILRAESSNKLHLATGSIVAMSVDSSQRVGIGTTSPSNPLHIYNAGTTRIRIDSGSNNAGIMLSESGSNKWSIASVSGGNLQFFSEAGLGNLMYLTSGGDLGIGTTSPSTKLQVGDGSSDDAIRAVFSDGNYTEMHGYGLQFSRGSSYIRPTTTGKNLIIGNASTAQQWANIRSYAIEHTWYSNQSASMFLNSSGDLGIGTTAPQAKLDVNGTVLLGREHGVTQLNNNKDYANMASGVVWREYNATGTYVHATNSENLTDYIKSYNFTDQGIATTVNSFTRSDDTYAVEFVGYYYAASNGVHQFSISSDDSGDIFIDGTRVGYWYGGHGDNDAPTGGSLGSGGGTVQTPGSIYLVKGFHKLYARFQEGTGGDSASLWHLPPSGSWAKIPADRLYHKAEDLFRATGSGNVTLTGTFTATADIVAYSDERIKENVETIDNALDKVQQLRGVSFNRIKDGSKSIGVIAQEIEKVLPEVVTEDDKGIKGVAYGNVVGVLIEAIKEQQKQIDELKDIIKNK